ncbi:MAG TPA: GNAT family protein [Candidatus Edwardsbacteria bacterium]|nr:GNAT family protein [Candidatus Edwardsbacteria bacterium]
MKKTNNIWVSDKVHLRAVEPKDLGTFYRNGREDDTECDRLCDTIHFPRPFEAMKAKVEALAKEEPKDDSFLWMIENRQGQVVGGINTFDCSHRHGTFKYGVAIMRKNWRKGYALEAIIIVLRYFFHEMRYQKATVHIYDFNAPSIKLHESLGFKHEGRLRRMCFTNGEHHDEVLMGMTKEEFDRKYPKQQP